MRRMGRQLAGFVCSVGGGACLLAIPAIWGQFRQLLCQVMTGRERVCHAGSAISGTRRAYAKDASAIMGRSTASPNLDAGMLERGKPQLPADSAKRGAATYPELCGQQLARKEEAPNARVERPPRLRALAPVSEPPKPAGPAPQEVASAGRPRVAPQHVITVKPAGYVEKADGLLEAIIVQDDHVQIVHIGEVFAGKYRVEKISADAVEAVEETVASAIPERINGGGPEVADTRTAAGASPAKPAVEAQVRPVSLAANDREDREAKDSRGELAREPLGYVERTDGRVDIVVADGENVRLLPQKTAAVVAQSNAPHIPEHVRKPQTSPRQGENAIQATSELAAGPVEKGHAPGRPPVGTIRMASFEPPAARPAVPRPFAARAEQPVQQQAGGASREAPSVPRDAVGPAGVSPEHSHFLDAARAVVKPIGFVEKANGEIDAVISEGDQVFVVKEGDHFGQRYRALRVSPDGVEVAEEPLPDSSPISRPRPSVLTAALSTGPSDSGSPHSVAPSQHQGWPEKSPAPRAREGAAAGGDHPETSTLAFQTLGYVETSAGEIEAIVADGSSVYLVKQGERFADTYRAVTVSPTLVLAVRVNPGWNVDGMLAARTDSQAEPASKLIYGTLHLAGSGKAGSISSAVTVAPAGPALQNLGVSFLNTLGLAALDQQ